MPQDRPEDYNTDLVSWTDGFLSRYQPGNPAETFSRDELDRINNRIIDTVDSGLEVEGE